MHNAEPIQFDCSGAIDPDWGISREQIESLSGKLEAIRDSIFEVDLPLLKSGGPIPAEMQPLDTAFVDLPERLLDEYEVTRPASEMTSILRTAKRMQGLVDRVVVLGIGGSYMECGL